MIKANANFSRLTQSYLFSTVARKIAAFKETHPQVEIIKMSIGDVTRPICPAAIEALHKAADDMATAEGFHGYGPEQGYDFLRKAIAETDYKGLGISADEIFISDGAKSDIGNFGDILSADATVAVPDPVYPVYVDTNIMAGRKIQFLPCTEANDFVPELPAGVAPDIIYLCYPNNPTGTTLTRTRLKNWVDFALKNRSLILFDSAYEIFITESNVPHSIYEIPGAKQCCVEFRSFSKTAGFTGLRCGYTVVPRELKDSDGVAFHDLWLRRQTTKFNGASYPIQRAAAAIYSEQGRRQIRETVAYYLTNAQILRSGLESLGFKAFGGINAPYIWLKTPAGTNSWEFFDMTLNRCGVATTPGVGFGPSGEGYVRLTAFNTLENTKKAIKRFENINSY